ncbi:uncharacterized protein LOC135394024 isoform X2 [Ornithodoros turicata]|uniref:uncharacterized protein LOC135394024 isoform X2 n=1 Tax=Ornithodoros turicata TaxID=34597 RepID=UPI0031399B31
MAEEAPSQPSPQSSAPCQIYQPCHQDEALSRSPTGKGTILFWKNFAHGTEDACRTPHLSPGVASISQPGGIGSSGTILFSNESDYGDTDDHLLCHTPDPQGMRAAIDLISQKIARARESIRAEQTARDENVNEYLKLATNADRQQMQRIKNIFEKKNQKSAQMIAQHQKKLKNYIKRKRDLETYGTSPPSWQPRDVLQNVGHSLSGIVGNIKGGLSGLASVAHSSTDNKYPSDDDSSSLASESSQIAPSQCISVGVAPTATASPRRPPLTSGGTGGCPVAGPVPGMTAVGAPTGGEAIVGSATSGPALAVGGGFTGTLGTDTDLEPFLIELSERKEECQRLTEEIEALKNQMRQEYTCFSQALQEERYRYEFLQEQMNDLIELHQNEVQNLKQGIADMEEKVQYQSEERLRDVQEILESCQTRVQLGESFVITCFLDYNADVSWMKDGIPVSRVLRQDEYTSTQHNYKGRGWGSSLRVHMAKLMHAGQYRCTEHSPGTHPVKVLPYVQATQRMTESKCYNLIINEPLELRCNENFVRHSSPHTATWYKNSRLLTPDTRVHVTPLGLTISKANEQDSGTYTCGNIASSRATSYGSYRVVTPIRIDPLLSFSRPMDGNSVQITCHIHAVPRPKVIWEVSGKYVREETPTELEHGVHRATLFLRNVTANDGYIYSCLATYVGCEDLAAELSLQAYGAESAIRTSEAFPGTGVTLNTSKKELRLQCVYPPDPSIRMRWFKDGVDIRNYPKRNKYNVDPVDQSLIIRNPSYDDVDNYTCHAVGTTERAVILVGIGVEIRKATSHTAAFIEGRKVSLTCKASGVPLPSVRWFKNNTVLSVLQIPRFSYNSSPGGFRDTLVISNLRKADAGKYACVADNGHSQAIERLGVEVKGKYDAMLPFLIVLVEVIALLLVSFRVRKKMTEKFVEREQPGPWSGGYIMPSEDSYPQTGPVVQTVVDVQQAVEGPKQTAEETHVQMQTHAADETQLDEKGAKQQNAEKKADESQRAGDEKHGITEIQGAAAEPVGTKSHMVQNLREDARDKAMTDVDEKCMVTSEDAEQAKARDDGPEPRSKPSTSEVDGVLQRRHGKSELRRSKGKKSGIALQPEMPLEDARAIESTVTPRGGEQAGATSPTFSPVLQEEAKKRKGHEGIPGGAVDVGSPQTFKFQFKRNIDNEGKGTQEVLRHISVTLSSESLSREPSTSRGVQSEKDAEESETSRRHLSLTLVKGPLMEQVKGSCSFDEKRRLPPLSKARTSKRNILGDDTDSTTSHSSTHSCDLQAVKRFRQVLLPNVGGARHEELKPKKRSTKPACSRTFVAVPHKLLHPEEDVRQHMFPKLVNVREQKSGTARQASTPTCSKVLKVSPHKHVEPEVRLEHHPELQEPLALRSKGAGRVSQPTCSKKPLLKPQKRFPSQEATMEDSDMFASGVERPTVTERPRRSTSRARKQKSLKSSTASEEVPSILLKRKGDKRGVRKNVNIIEPRK